MNKEVQDSMTCEEFGRFSRPKLTALLGCLKLDATYVQARENYLYRSVSKPESSPQPVLDLVGGFGAALLGHNHPDLVETVNASLRSGVPVMAQGTTRQAAGKLARELDTLACSNGRYYSIFTNSGTEAVEAALKHAYKQRFDAVRRHYESTTRKLYDAIRRAGQLNKVPELPGGQKSLSKLRVSALMIWCRKTRLKSALHRYENWDRCGSSAPFLFLRV